MGAAQASANVSNQENKQTNINIQETEQTTRNNSKQENMQDYVTFIRLNTRNITEMKKNTVNNLKAYVNAQAVNEEIIKGCVEFDAPVLVKQINNVDQQFEKSFESLQNLITNIKNAAQNESTTSTETEQSSGVKQGNDGQIEQGSELNNENKQGIDQQNTFIPRMISPFKYASNVNTDWNKRYVEDVFLNGNRGSRVYQREFDEAFARSLRTGSGIMNDGTESFVPCAFLCAAVNISNQTSEQYNENRQISRQILENNDEIRQKIDVAYEKLSDIYNDTKEVLNTTNTSDGGMTVFAINRHIVDSGPECKNVFKKEYKVIQQNNTKQALYMSGVINTIIGNDIDNDAKAIMADMMHLTEKAETDQTNAAGAKQESKLGNLSEQKASLLNGLSTTAIIAIVVGIIVFCIVLPTIIKSINNSGNKRGIPRELQQQLLMQQMMKQNGMQMQKQDQ